MHHTSSDFFHFLGVKKSVKIIVFFVLQGRFQGFLQQKQVNHKAPTFV